MSRLEFQVDFLDEVVDRLVRLASGNEDTARRLAAHARTCRDRGGSGWVSDQLMHASSILAGHQGQFHSESRDLRGRVEIVRSTAEGWDGNQADLRRHLAALMAPGVGVGLAGSAVLGAHAGPKGFKGIWDLPFLGQIGSAFLSFRNSKDFTIDRATGGANCGPTSLAMVIDYYVKAGKAIPGKPALNPQEAANVIRGGAEHNQPIYFDEKGHQHYATTGFGLDDGDTDKRSVELLKSYGLGLAPIDKAKGLDDVKTQLDAGHPVVMLVDNYQYADAGKSGDKIYGSMSGALTHDHIVVVTGYDSTSVYINDPLAAGTGKISITDFTNAATTGDRGDARPWYGAAVVPANASPEPKAAFDLPQAPIASPSATFKPK